MKRFSFNLEKLLQLRGFEEKNAKTELAAAISVAERIKLDLRNTAAERVRVYTKPYDRRKLCKPS